MLAQIDKSYIKVNSLWIILKRFICYLLEGRPLTTKGRWFNIVTKNIIRLSFILKPKQEVTIIYILGQGRTGSTYLGKVMSCCANSILLNEPKLAWYLSNKSDDLLNSYGDQGSYFYSNVTSKTQQNIQSFYNFVSKITHSKVIIDKYPEMLFRFSWLNGNIKNCKFIILFRAYESVLNSIPKWNTKHSTIDSDWWGKNNTKWDLIVKELIPRSNYKLILNEILNNKIDDYDRSLIEWILTTEKQVELLSNNEHLIIINYDEMLKSFVILQRKLPNDYINSFRYLEKTYKVKKYNGLSKTFDNKLITIANQLQEKFYVIWKEYSKERN